MNLNKKDMISVVITFVVTIVSVILFFFPDVVGYEKSYVAIEEKKNLIEINNQTILQNETQITSLDESTVSLREQAQSVKLMADKEERILSEVPKTLDIPSLLISLEKEAAANKVSFLVDYAGIQKNAMAPVPTTEEQPVQQEEKSVQQSVQSNETGKPAEASMETSVETSAVDSPEQKEAVTQLALSGIQTAIVPIEISGGYKNVRKYISYLDGIGLIKPSNVHLYSEGKVVVAVINLNVMYGGLLDNEIR